MVFCRSRRWPWTLISRPNHRARSKHATSRSLRRSRRFDRACTGTCARMTGSVMDGEDVVQEALFEAYRKLDKFDESRPLKPWLFRIAHNRCIDFLRQRGVRDEAATAAAAVPDVASPHDPALLGNRQGG